MLLYLICREINYLSILFYKNILNISTYVKVDYFKNVHVIYSIFMRIHNSSIFKNQYIHSSSA